MPENPTETPALTPMGKSIREALDAAKQFKEGDDASAIPFLTAIMPLVGKMARNEFNVTHEDAAVLTDDEISLVVAGLLMTIMKGMKIGTR